MKVQLISNHFISSVASSWSRYAPYSYQYVSIRLSDPILALDFTFVADAY